VKASDEGLTEIAAGALMLNALLVAGRTPEALI
jgi:hypothetical protein